jgi:penicillin-binding protein 2
MILTTPADYPAVRLEITPVREYPLGASLAHVIGYTGEISSEELSFDETHYYASGDSTGRQGIERSYETTLRGIKGRGETVIDASGNIVSSSSTPTEQPQSGHDLVLTIDSALQQKTTEALHKSINTNHGKAGVAIMLNVRDGSILTLVSLPGYDDNLFSGYTDPTELQKLYDESANNPLFNRAIAGQYQPGSTFKTITATAALEEGTITTSTRITDPGVLKVGGSTFPCWINKQYGGAHGTLTVRQAIGKSCDVFFYEVGAGYDAIPALGSERLQAYAYAFGLGQKSGIDLPGEAAGSVQSEKDFTAAGEDWYWGNTAHMAIGQGYTTVTPIQMAAAIAAIANGGTLYQPHILKEIKTSAYEPGQVVAPVITKAAVASAQTLQVVREGMREAVYGAGGTAPQLRSLPVTVAGKTGTAQHDKRLQDHAWFVSFAPYENPEIALVVLVEEGGEGSVAAVPVVQEVLQYYFTR